MENNYQDKQRTTNDTCVEVLPKVRMSGASQHQSRANTPERIIKSANNQRSAPSVVAIMEPYTNCFLTAYLRTVA